MPSSFGNQLRVSIFGQSHSQAIGCVVEGLPAGFHVDTDGLAAFLARRSPGHGPWSTTRREPDAPRIVSGLNPAGETCGTPLAAIIENTNTRSQDYNNLRHIPRPGHADWPAQVKWQGAQDVAGGGHFSGRLTAPLCIAGGIALQILAKKGVRIAAHLLQVGSAFDDNFDAIALDHQARIHLAAQLAQLQDGRIFPTISERAGAAMQAAIEDARQDQDSVGGMIECVALGLPAGIGGPAYDGIESVLARIIFGIPAIKSLEFGAGSAVAGRRGSQNNDPYLVEDGHIRPAKNNAGGNLGGITTGAPLLFRVAVKPTSSIGIAQRSVNMDSNQPAELVVKGRHDPCIAPRAVPVVEAACALAVLDSWLSWPTEHDRCAGLAQLLLAGYEKELSRYV